MSKNIILCSDGTGNSGGAVNTNVWRLYEAIDRSPTRNPPQLRFYDDGVGTQENTYIRAISAAVGWGVRKNVIQLYTFLLQQYKPGDNVFVFGFSRGAFTARVFANLLFYCGIANAFLKDTESPRKSPEEIEKLAKDAVAAYEKRSFCDPYQGPPHEFRQKHGLQHATNVEGEPGWFRLHFIGVWDTVEAYGLPVDELADALGDTLGCFPLRFKEEERLRENDLHPLIDNAYHAIAIDDERHSFHPKLWIQAEPFDPVNGAELPGSERVMAFGAVTPIPERKVRQVWFAGMHSNVGGGYPQDQMSHVSLLWMIEAARKAGLFFDHATIDDYQQEADHNGRMYDSRSAFGLYYRYRPRDLRVLCAEAGIQQPTIHKSAFERIERHTDAYAPTGVPKDYLVEPPGVPSGEVDPQGRIDWQHYVDDLIWKRRVLYGVFIAGTASFLGCLWYLANHQTPLESERWGCTSLCLYHVLQPFVNIVAWSIPVYFKPGWIELGHRPWLLLALAILFGTCLYLSIRWRQKIQLYSNKAWTAGFDPQHLVNVRGLPELPPVSRFRTFRDDPARNVRAEKFQRRWAPKLLLAALFLGVLVILWRWFAPLVSSCESAFATPDKPAVEQLSATFAFDTKNPMFPAPVLVEAGQSYRITVEPHRVPNAKSKWPWLDNTLAASPDGIQEPEPWLLKLFSGLKRCSGEKWFKVMASIGPGGEELIPIGTSHQFIPQTSGRLFLFVNDARGFYDNNQGTATVTVEQLD